MTFNLFSKATLLMACDTGGEDKAATDLVNAVNTQKIDQKTEKRPIK